MDAEILHHFGLLYIVPPEAERTWGSVRLLPSAVGPQSETSFNGGRAGLPMLNSEALESLQVTSPHSTITSKLKRRDRSCSQSMWETVSEPYATSSETWIPVYSGSSHGLSVHMKTVFGLGLS